MDHEEVQHVYKMIHTHMKILQALVPYSVMVAAVINSVFSSKHDVMTIRRVCSHTLIADLPEIAVETNVSLSVVFTIVCYGLKVIQVTGVFMQSVPKLVLAI